MTFKGLSDRFEAKASEIYGKFSARENNTGQPFLEFKPNDPNRNEANADTFEVPAGSFSRDKTRIGRFLKSDDGVFYLLKQAELQTGNAFSETRLYDPLFPFGKVLLNGNPVRRPLSTALDDLGSGGSPSTITGALGSFVRGVIAGQSGNDLSTERSPGSNGVGSAGRLQNETATTAINTVLGKSGPTGLLNLLPPNVITRAVSAIQNILNEGSLNTNQRPEFNVDGQMYSVLLWEGFNRSLQNQPNQFFKAGQDLRGGNFKSVISDVEQGIKTAITSKIFGTSGAPIPTSPPNGRDDPSNTAVDGLRYFITDQSNVDKYIIADNLSFLNREPYFLSGDAVNPTVSITSTSFVQQAIQKANNVESQAQSFFGKINGFVKTASTALFGRPLSLPFSQNILSLSSAISNTFDISSANAAEDAMLFSNLSLQNRYLIDSGDVGFIRDNIDAQKAQGLETIQVLSQAPSFNGGYAGGLTIGVDVNDDLQNFARKKVKVDGGRYFHDGAIELGAIPVYENQDSSDSVRTVSPDLKDQIRSVQNDAIDFLFHDFTNNRVLPFKALLSDISETISPEYESQKYIGRVERNIIYAGAMRELNFSFFVQASAKEELDYIWQKLNYLTGLCFPATYSDGFMVPPFVQLTIGQFYVDQPGYIKSLVYSIDENTSWDIDVDAQMPMGVRATMNFSVIEKNQVSTGFGFYGLGTPQLISE